MVQGFSKVIHEKFYSHHCSHLPGFPPILRKRKITPWNGFLNLSRDLKKCLYKILHTHIHYTNYSIHSLSMMPSVPLYG